MINILNVLAALGQQTRLEVLTLLSRGPADGQTSGQARVPANSMTTHLCILAAAGLVSATKSGRQVVYRMETAAIESALEILSARLLAEPMEHRFRAGSSVTAASPVAVSLSWSHKALRGTGSAISPITVVVGRMSDDSAGNGPDDRSGPAVQLSSGDQLWAPGEDGVTGVAGRNDNSRAHLTRCRYAASHSAPSPRP